MSKSKVLTALKTVIQAEKERKDILWCCQKELLRYYAVLRKYQLIVTVEERSQLEKPITLIQHNSNYLLAVNPAMIRVDQLPTLLDRQIQKLVLKQLSLTTKRLWIRRVQTTDIDAFFAITANEENAVNDGYNPDTDREQYAETFAWFLKGETIYAIERLSDHQVIGCVSVRENEKRVVITYDIGYNINCAYWRQGYAYEALSALTAFFFDELHVPLLTAGCFTFNLPSQKLLLKLGFTQEGVLHKAFAHARYGAIDLMSFYKENPNDASSNR